MHLIDEHCAHLVRLNRRPRTIEQRRWCLMRLGRHLAPGSLLDTTVHDLRSFTSRADFAIETKAAEVGHLRSFFRWLVIEGLRDDDPTTRLERPTREPGLPNPMPDEHVTHALRNAPEPFRSWFYLAAYAGLRACEVAPLAGEDVTGGIIIVREEKGGGMGTVPLSPILEPIVARHPRAGIWFPHRGYGPYGPVSPGQLQRHANRWLHDNGIEHTFHSLRHWFGTNVYRATRDLRVTQELMRHKSIQSTIRYTKLFPDDGRHAIGLLPAV